MKKNKPAKIGQSEIKRGRLSTADMAYIAKNAKAGMPAEEIAKNLGRSFKQVSEYAIKNYGIGDNLPAKAIETAEHVRELKNKPEWKFIKDHYSLEEIEYYQYQYGNLMEQFKDDIMATEEVQIFLLIHNMILVSRTIRNQRSADLEMINIEREIELIKSGNEIPYPDNIKLRIQLLVERKNQLLDQTKKKSEEWTSYSKKIEETIQKLKGTREQRIQNIENAKETFVGLIRLLQDKKFREREGRQMEWRRIATDQAKDNFSQPHLYMNGEWDQPILKSDNILVQDAQNEIEI